MSDYEDIVGPSKPDPEISKRIKQGFGLEATVSQDTTPKNTEIRRTEKELEILDLLGDANLSRVTLLEYMGKLKNEGYAVPKLYGSWDEHQLGVYLRSRKLLTQEKLEDLLHPDAA